MLWTAVAKRSDDTDRETPWSVHSPQYCSEGRAEVSPSLFPDARFRNACPPFVKKFSKPVAGLGSGKRLERVTPQILASGPRGEPGQDKQPEHTTISIRSYPHDYALHDSDLRPACLCFSAYRLRHRRIRSADRRTALIWSNCCGGRPRRNNAIDPGLSAKGLANGPELAPRLLIARNDALAVPRLIFSGSAGKSYDLQAASTLGGNSWQSILTVNLGADPVGWDDELKGSAPFRFYRLRSSEEDALGDSVPTFRLLDQQGIARDLYYHTHLSAMVVLAAGNDLTVVSPWTNVLAEIAKVYTNRIQIWILHSDRAASRSNVLAQARSLNLSFRFWQMEAGSRHDRWD